MHECCCHFHCMEPYLVQNLQDRFCRFSQNLHSLRLESMRNILFWIIQIKITPVFPNVKLISSETCNFILVETVHLTSYGARSQNWGVGWTLPHSLIRSLEHFDVKRCKSVRKLKLSRPRREVDVYEAVPPKHCPASTDRPSLPNLVMQF